MGSSIAQVACSVLPRALLQEGRELKETCTSPLPTMKSRMHPGHPRGSLVLEQNFGVFLMISEAKRE